MHNTQNKNDTHSGSSTKGSTAGTVLGCQSSNEAQRKSFEPPGRSAVGKHLANSSRLGVKFADVQLLGTHEFAVAQNLRDRVTQALVFGFHFT